MASFIRLLASQRQRIYLLHNTMTILNTVGIVSNLRIFLRIMHNSPDEVNFLSYLSM